jgi:uroporphyrinogen-III synthase
VLRDYFEENHIKYHECVLYNTVSQKPYPLPDLKTINEIVFTSPSTVNAWLELFGQLPANIPITAIGPITKACLSNHLKFGINVPLTSLGVR